MGKDFTLAPYPGGVISLAGRKTASAMGIEKKATWTTALLLLSLGAGCTSIVGTFTQGTGEDGGNPDGGHGRDAAPDAQPDGHADSGKHPDGGMHHDSSTDAPPDVLPDVLPDVSGDAPPTTANSALSLTAGGAFSTSTNYKLTGALGQAPGGNTSSSSTSFKLQGGVIGATQ
jgi:hypothetical protein